MKRAFLFLSLAGLLATPATAFDGAGLYLGVTGTLSPGQVTDDVEASDALGGGMFGAQVGYRYRAGSLMPGVEFDYLWGGIETDTGNERIGIDQIGTLRATLGVPLGPLLPYASAGAALAQTSIEDASLIDEPLQDNVHLGFTVGAGVEFALTSAISVRGEYQYFSLGPMEDVLREGTGGLNHDLHAFKIGANWNF